jgi:hypothetical protein
MLQNFALKRQKIFTTLHVLKLAPSSLHQLVFVIFPYHEYQHNTVRKYVKRNIMFYSIRNTINEHWESHTQWAVHIKQQTLSNMVVIGGVFVHLFTYAL